MWSTPTLAMEVMLYLPSHDRRGFNDADINKDLWKETDGRTKHLQIGIDYIPPRFWNRPFIVHLLDLKETTAEDPIAIFPDGSKTSKGVCGNFSKDLRVHEKYAMDKQANIIETEVCPVSRHSIAVCWVKGNSWCTGINRADKVARKTANQILQSFHT